LTGHQKKRRTSSDVPADWRPCASREPRGVADCYASELRAQAARDGLRSLRVSGAEKIAKGPTTMDEVLKAAPLFVS